MIIRKSLANGGTITGDLLITGGLTVEGSFQCDGDISIGNIQTTGIIEADQGAMIHQTVTFDKTLTTAGTTGNQTINTITGSVNFAAGATSLTVTNSLVGTDSLIFTVIMTNDATAVLKNCVPSSGSFVIRMATAPTAETKVGFFVTN